MEKGGDTGDISLLFFLLVLICGPFWVIFGPFFGANFFGQKFISAIFITFSISGLPGSQSFLLPRSKVTPGADIVGSLWGGRCRIVV